MCPIAESLSKANLLPQLTQKRHSVFVVAWCKSALFWAGQMLWKRRAKPPFLVHEPVPAYCTETQMLILDELRRANFPAYLGEKIRIKAFVSRDHLDQSNSAGIPSRVA